MALTLCLRSVSQRVYTGPRSQPGRGGNRWFRLIPWAFVALTIGLQIAWVLVPDSARVAVTAASVTAFFLALARPFTDPPLRISTTSALGKH